MFSWNKKFYDKFCKWTDCCCFCCNCYYQCCIICCQTTDEDKIQNKNKKNNDDSNICKEMQIESNKSSRNSIVHVTSVSPRDMGAITPKEENKFVYN